MADTTALDLDDDSPRWDADEALTRMYAAHWRPLVRLSYLLVRDQQVAEEIVQDAFLSVHHRWSRLADHERALAYLRVCVANASRSALRKQAVRRRWADAGGPTRIDPAPHTPQGEHSAEDAVLRAEEHRAVNAVLAALPTRQREVLVLRYHGGLTEAEIAETLQISAGAVKSHAHRGLAAMRAVLAMPDARSGDLTNQDEDRS